MRSHRILVSSLLMACIGVLGTPSAEAESSHPRLTPCVEAVNRVKDAVVNIHSERTVKGPAAEDLFVMAPSQNRINGMGTGIVIDPRGYIITNQHVVEDVNLIRVRLADGRTNTARVLARDTESDLALLKIEVKKPLQVIPLGTAQDLMVGESVIAVGNAYGYEHTVTRGIVSAIKRDVTLNKEISYKSLIQTDASINPGNSGGPLLNIHGELIGVNVAIRAGSQGIAFAIPVDTMLRVAADMMSIRKRNGTWHGVVGRDQLEFHQLQHKRSLVVDRVEAGSPAAKAGLQTGDVVVKVADLPVSTMLEWERGLLDATIGDRVPVVVRRSGQELQLVLTVAADERGTLPPPELVWRKLGLRLQPVNAELVTRVNAQLHGGLAVADIDPNGLAGKSGIQRGDILVGLHQWETLSVDNVAFVLSHPDLPSFNPLRFFIVRAGQVHRGWIQQVE